MSWKVFRTIIDWGSRMFIVGVTLEYLFNNYGTGWMLVASLFLLYWILLPWVEYTEERFAKDEKGDKNSKQNV